MSDAANIASQESAAVGGTAPNATTAGRLIAARRVQAGMHLAAVAATLKVPMHRLEALEADRYDAFPDTVFLRALASSVCRVLKSDPAPVLALLPQLAPATFESRPDLNARFKEGTAAGGASSLPMSRAMAFTVIVLLAAALVLAFLPRDGAQAPQPETDSAEPLPAPANAVSAPAPAPAPEENEAPAAETAAAAPVAASQDVAQAQPATPQADAPAHAAPEAPLLIQARDQTWVQVRDASGSVIVEKTLQKGDKFAAQGTGPWSVVVGRADAADVVVRGQAMDLMGIARSNVARFEVK